MIDISKVTDNLYVGARIIQEHVDEIKLLKFDLIISMIGEYAPEEIYTMPPFKTLWIQTKDSFLHPISIKKLALGVEAANPVIQAGGKVLVFCMEGRRRSVAMAASILVSLGHTSEEATGMLLKARKVADPRCWYINSRIRAFERFWKKKTT